MSESDRDVFKEYDRIKDKSKKIERSAPLAFALFFVILIVFLILSETVWKYFLYISLGLFALSTGVFTAILVFMNKKLKNYEKIISADLTAEKTEDKK